MSKRKNQGSLPQQSRSVPPAPSNNGQQTETSIAIHSGPIPAPIVLEQYDRIYPGAAKIIIEMSQKEANHRHEMNILHSTESFKYHRRGQYIGGIIGTVGILVGGTVAVLGAATTGAVIGGGTVVSLVSIFVIGKVLESNKSKKK